MSKSRSRPRNESIPVYGLDKELKDKADAKYDHAMEAEVKTWIEAVTGKDLGDDIFATLQSGVLLCELVNIVKPGTIKKINKMKMPFMQMENINAFLDAAKAFGVPAPDLFMTVDLYEFKNKGQVIQTLQSFGRVAPKVGYRGPTIGPKLADKNPRNHSKAKMNAGKSAVPLLTDGAGKAGNAAKAGPKGMEHADIVRNVHKW